ncbi:triose-phosphate transporter family-domain-containing protein [Dactylonectria estremocensis]|uniref:Triose-phosphate transporter family-domain-containing protein n=1 Tax=Dactylonectria estremocensis TaxID=1079267 RepID=A0A9P9D9Y2_9HYPO|nr:triose-phosphate transporter family-domain-containing protein [Dactylonectria estremocensis]
MARYALPTAATTPAAPRASPFQIGSYMVAWIMSSNFTILVNKWLIDTAGFGYPILLTYWHLVFASIVTQVLARTTSLLHRRHHLPINGRFFFRTILPIGLVSSGSLVCTNFVYFYLSVAFLQMVKASTPVVVLLVSWLWGIANPSIGDIGNILVIVAGVTLASIGEIHFSWIGLAFQMAGILFEAMRVVLLQVLVSGEGLNMDPLVGLYYYAPICAAINFLVACIIELPSFTVRNMTQSGCLMLFISAPVTFLLNLTSMALIGQTSAVMMSLAAIFKNILLVICSVIIWQSQITTMQFIGYGISLAGLIYYSFGYDKLMEGCRIIIAWVRSIFKSSLGLKHSTSP